MTQILEFVQVQEMKNLNLVAQEALRKSTKDSAPFVEDEDAVQHQSRVHNKRVSQQVYFNLDMVSMIESLQNEIYM